VLLLPHSLLHPCGIFSCPVASDMWGVRQSVSATPSVRSLPRLRAVIALLSPRSWCRRIWLLTRNWVARCGISMEEARLQLRQCTETRVLLALLRGHLVARVGRACCRAAHSTSAGSAKVATSVPFPVMLR
jgi:hypothetical protein